MYIHVVHIVSYLILEFTSSMCALCLSLQINEMTGKGKGGGGGKVLVSRGIP